MSPFTSARFSPVRLSEFAPSRCVCSVCPFCIEPFGSFPFCLVFRFAPLCFFGFSRIHIILFRFVPLRSHSCALIVLDPGGACAEQFSYCACRLDPSVDVRLLEWWTSPTLIFSEGSTSLPGGNQVDGLPPASSSGAGRASWTFFRN